MATPTMKFAPVGTFGVEAAIEGDHVFLRIPLDKKAGRVSQSGKMILAGSTGGFANIPGSDFRLNVSAGWNTKGA